MEPPTASSWLAGHVANRTRLRWLAVSAPAHRRSHRPSRRETKWQEPMSRKDAAKSKRIKSSGGEFFSLNTQWYRYVMLRLKTFFFFFYTDVSYKGGDL